MKTDIKYQVGDFVSVWNRDSRRHKWKLEFGYVLLTRFNGDNSFSVQTNETHVRGKSWTVANFSGEGTWERKLDKPIFDVKANKKSIKQ